MKKMILILGALLAASGVIKAQDTIRYPDSCYMYNPFTFNTECGSVVCDGIAVDGEPSWTLNARQVGDGWEQVYNPIDGSYYWTAPGIHRTFGRYKEYIAKGQTLIYGIAATTGVLSGGEYANSGRYLDSIYTLGELYNVDYITDSNFNLYAYLFRVTGGEVYCVDSVKWIRHNNPYRFFEYRQYPPPGFETFYDSTYVTYSYEFYFDHPVSVVDTFLIGLRFPYARELACMYTIWYEAHICSGDNNLAQYLNYRTAHMQLDKYDFCSTQLRYPGNLWGGFFPILTPQDTTRCESVRDLRMIQATDTSIMLEWHGAGATQWEVEYAAAAGMTAYSVVTTTTRVTLTGLRPTTTYLAHVRAWCARDSAYGEWSSFVELQTTAHQQPDTTQGPDTVKIDVVGLFTRLAPNPATGLVTVQSSYSLSHVAVYDVQGHLVLEQKAAGTAATFDVGSLPEGVYVVSVRTAAGTTTKRLLVE